MRQFLTTKQNTTPGSAAQPASEQDLLVSAERPVNDSDWRICSKCGVYEPFRFLSEESCYLECNEACDFSLNEWADSSIAGTRTPTITMDDAENAGAAGAMKLQLGQERQRLLTSGAGSSSAAQPASPDADTHDVGARSSEQPAEKGNFDWPKPHEIEEGVLVQCFEFELSELEHITPPHLAWVSATRQSTYECVRKKRLDPSIMATSARGERSEPPSQMDKHTSLQG